MISCTGVFQRHIDRTSNRIYGVSYLYERNCKTSAMPTARSRKSNDSCNYRYLKRGTITIILRIIIQHQKNTTFVKKDDTWYWKIQHCLAMIPSNIHCSKSCSLHIFLRQRLFPSGDPVPNRDDAGEVFSAQERRKSRQLKSRTVDRQVDIFAMIELHNAGTPMTISP